MTEDTRKELERIEKELLEQEPVDILQDEVILSVMAEPAFDDEVTIHTPDGPMVYRNFSNDYGRDLEEEAPAKELLLPRKDRVDTVLLFTASGLCLGIIGVLTYWLIKFL
jgi:hypothetical protein